MTRALITSSVLIGVWSIGICVLSAAMGFFSSDFFHFGPSETAQFFQVPIDTWTKWSAIVGFTIFNQLVMTIGLETLSPWQINEVQNRQTTTLNESEPQALAYIMNWYLYLWISRIMSIQMVLSQVDFMLVVLATDLATTFSITKWYYLRYKQCGEFTIARPSTPEHYYNLDQVWHE